MIILPLSRGILWKKVIKMANYNVVNNPNGGWDAKQDHALRSSFHGDKQSIVEAAAKQFALNSGGGEVRIQGRNGQFRDSDTVSPAKDPNPPKDKKY